MGLQDRGYSPDRASPRLKNDVRILMQEMHHVLCSGENSHRMVIEIDGAGLDQKT